MPVNGAIMNVQYMSSRIKVTTDTWCNKIFSLNSTFYFPLLFHCKIITKKKADVTIWYKSSGASMMQRKIAVDRADVDSRT